MCTLIELRQYHDMYMAPVVIVTCGQGGTFLALAKMYVDLQVVLQLLEYSFSEIFQKLCLCWLHVFVPLL